jgi:integrase/recombinase XerD
MEERFEEFLRERKYLKNVSPKTLVYYGCAFKSWEKHSHGDWKTWIVNLQQAGLSAISINTYICAMNAYWKWGDAGLKVDYLKEEQKILATLTAEQVRRMVAFKPRGANQTRAHTAALLMLDGGYRISEILGLAFEHCDFDNLVVKVRGKGNKHRLVPLSTDMRKTLYRYAMKHSGPARLMFGTRNRTRVTVRNFQRDFKLMGQKLNITGVRFSPHTLRHTFAVSYLRNGGNLFYLSKILGHTSVKTTERYLQSVGVDDLQAVHDRLSPLSPEHLRGRVEMRWLNPVYARCHRVRFISPFSLHFIHDGKEERRAFPKFWRVGTKS